MSRLRATSLATLVLLFTSGCVGVALEPPLLDAGDLDADDLDAGDLDAGDLDAGDLDAGDLDAGDLDAGDLDAGDLDAGDLDAGTDAGRCPPTAWCEDFESGLDAGWVPRVTDDGGLWVDVPPAGSTTPGHALRVEVERGRATMRLRVPSAFSSDAGYHFFGRTLLFGAQLPADSENRRHGWVTLEGTSPEHGSYSQVGFRHDNGRRPYGNFFVLSPWQDCWGNAQPTAQRTPTGAWFCYEWEFDSVSNTVRMWQDGVLQVDLVGTGSGCTDGMAARPWVLPASPELSIGFYTYDVVSLRGWVDDVVLDTTRVGCP